MKRHQNQPESKVQRHSPISRRSAARVSCARRSTHSVSPATGRIVPASIGSSTSAPLHPNLSDEENKLSVSSAPSFLWVFGLGWHHLTSDCDIEVLELDSRIRPLAFGHVPRDDDRRRVRGRQASSIHSPSKTSRAKEVVIRMRS